jgi:hypothetical protein
MKTNSIKTLLLFAFISISSFISAQTYKVGDKLDSGIVYYVDGSGKHGLIAATKDCGKLNWGDAVTACNALGTGWHLPTKDELTKLYKMSDKVGGFGGAYYWSSTEMDRTDAWFQDFRGGVQNANDKVSKHDVRAVKTF